MKKRLLSILLVLALCAALLPGAALAEGEAVKEVWTAEELTDAIQDGASSIKLMQDITLDSGLTITGALTLDLAGRKLTFNEAAGTAIDVGGNTLTLDDSSTEGTGELVVLCDTGIYINRGKLVLNGGTISAAGRTALKCEGNTGTASAIYVWIDANGGIVSGATDIFQGKIGGTGGTIFEGNVKISGDNGDIYGGIYRSDVTFDIVYNCKISGSVFYGRVTKCKTINGGLFYGKVTNCEVINGGTFLGGIEGYTPDPDTAITIDFGDGSEPKTGYILGSTVPPLGTPPAREGYTFAGWYWDADFKNPVNFDEQIPVKKGMTLYAKWKSEAEADGDGFVIAGGLLSGLLESAANALEETFVDVSRGAYYYNAVQWAAERGIAGGVDKKHFAPDESCTRAQAVTMLWRAAGCPAVWTENPFEDVDADDYYYEAVLWAVANGITSGADETHFSPDEPCTRGQIVTFLHRAARCYDAHESFGFVDVKTGSYCEDAVNWAVENAITNGTDVATFSPDETCTRGQIVTFLYRNR